MELTGAQIFVECLKQEGVKHLFGYPGGAVLHLYDALYKQTAIDHILVRHEQGAVHCAEGYAKSSHRPGVVLVTSGPGATNAVTGIADAYMDSVPLVVFTGQVPSSLIGNDAFQEVDIVGITRPCVKHNFLVKEVEAFSDIIKKAFYIATSGRPGPVLVDIPKDITAAKTEWTPEAYAAPVQMRSYSPTDRGHHGQIKKAVDLILSARRPMIYSGGGVVLGDAAAELIQFTKTLGYPITQTLMGLGAFPASDRQFVGMLGMHGTYEANLGMHHSDVLIAIGARFDDRVTGNIDKFCPHAKIVHVDVDPSSIAKNVTVDVPIVGQVGEVLKAMNEQLQSRVQRPDQAALDAWWQQIEQWRAQDCLSYQQDDAVIKPQYVVRKAWEVTGGDAIVTSDVGQHQMFVAQFYGFDKPRRWINSGGLGTMGFGLPAALGCQLANPEATVVCITGESSIQMCIQELSMAKQHGLPVKIINLNNGYMGMVRQWQDFFYQGRHAHSYFDSLPDFVKLTEAFGHTGMKIDKPGDVEPALRDAFGRKDELVFMDFIVDPKENVYPMIPAGAGQNEMILV